METCDVTPELEGQSASGGNHNGPPAGKAIKLTLRSLRLYQLADALSGGLIYLMVVFSPWAFGTTQPWSVWVMNVCGYTLGLLLLLKLFVRYHHGYRPARWGEPPGKKESAAAALTGGRLLVGALAGLTVLILGYCLISALNARATYQPAQMSFIYHECIPWLPHSYDSNSTWLVFWNYLALAFSFWALRDWLLGRSAGEARAQRQGTDGRDLAAWFPQRLRRLLWLLSLNGALLGVEGISQRISGTNKLLWFMPTRLNRNAVCQFGPYAYRANGARYLNLVWPATLGLWWGLQRAARRRLNRPLKNTAQAPCEGTPPAGFLGNRAGCGPGDSTGRLPDWTVRPSAGSSGWRHHVLLPCVLVMAACPIISTSRGGAVVAVSMIVAAAFILIFAMRRRHPITRFAMVLFFTAVFALGAYVGGDPLMERMGEFGNNLTGREASYETARSMARDHPRLVVGLIHWRKT